MPLSILIHILHFKQRIMAVYCLGFQESDGKQNLNSNPGQAISPTPTISFFFKSFEFYMYVMNFSNFHLSLTLSCLSSH